MRISNSCCSNRSHHTPHHTTPHRSYRSPLPLHIYNSSIIQIYIKQKKSKNLVVVYFACFICLNFYFLVLSCRSTHTNGGLRHKQYYHQYYFITLLPHHQHTTPIEPITTHIPKPLHSTLTIHISKQKNTSSHHQTPPSRFYHFSLRHKKTRRHAPPLSVPKKTMTLYPSQHIMSLPNFNFTQKSPPTHSQPPQPTTAPSLN